MCRMKAQGCTGSAQDRDEACALLGLAGFSPSSVEIDDIIIFVLLCICFKYMIQ